MGHAAWLWLVMIGAAHASDSALTEPLLDARAAALSLAGEPALSLALDPALAPVVLALPCLGCRAGLRAATEHYARPAEAEPAPSAPAQAVKPAVARRPLALGDTWKLGARRAFSIHLTPSPEECAPLVRLTF